VKYFKNTQEIQHTKINEECMNLCVFVCACARVCMCMCTVVCVVVH